MLFLFLFCALLEENELIFSDYADRQHILDEILCNCTSLNASKFNT